MNDEPLTQGGVRAVKLPQVTHRPKLSVLGMSIVRVLKLLTLVGEVQVGGAVVSVTGLKRRERSSPSAYLHRYPQACRMYELSNSLWMSHTR